MFPPPVAQPVIFRALHTLIARFEQLPVFLATDLVNGFAHVLGHMEGEEYTSIAVK